VRLEEQKALLNNSTFKNSSNSNSTYKGSTYNDRKIIQAQ